MRKHINELGALLVLPAVARLLIGQVPGGGPGDVLTPRVTSTTQPVLVSQGFVVLFVIVAVALIVALFVMGIRVNRADKERLRQELNVDTHKPL